MPKSWIRALSCVIAAVLPALAAAQPPAMITGQVTTRDDGLPVPGATVSIESLSLTATTDAGGAVPARAPPLGLRTRSS